VDGKQKAVNRRAKSDNKSLHNSRGIAKKMREQVKFTPPKIKVSAASFDRVLGKLIQSEPQPEKRLK
jgi:hypothetical protein